VDVGYRLGVDLGTTFTAAAIERDGRVDIVSLGNHAASIPSLVFFRADDDVLIGDAAERRGVQDPARLARAFKRRFGDPTPILLDRTPVSADRLTAMMLRQVVADITTRQGGSPDGVGVAHPANWGQFKIDLLRQSVELAGLSSATFVSEPVAAAVQYASGERVDVGDVIAVYDLGGGTFDAAVLRKTATGFDTLGQPQGIERLGGIDFDEAVFAHVRNTIGEAMSELDTSDPTVRAAIARLREECILAKEALSSDSEATIPVMLPNLQTQVRLPLSEFEDMIRPTLRETIETLRRAITVAGVEVAEVKAVLLAGGSSRIPLISELVRTELGRPVVTDAHPKHAVAMGAARVATQAMALAESGPVPAEPVPPVVVPEPVPAAVETPIAVESTPPTTPVPVAAIVATPTIAPRAASVHTEPKGTGKKKFVLLGVAALIVAGGGAVWAMTQSNSNASATQPTVKPVVTTSTLPSSATTVIPTTVIPTTVIPTTAGTTSSSAVTTPVPTAPAPTTPVVVATQAQTIETSPAATGVPNVFKLPQADAEALLVAAGYVPKFARVCSHSVADGEVRQVLFTSGGQQVIVVDLQGALPEAAGVPPGTELLVKVGNGKPCN
jgi:molecular chaperone DnaK